MNVDLSPLLNTGVAGVIIWWFMTRAEVHLREQAAAMDRMSRSVLLAVLAMETLSTPDRKRVQSILAELDEADRIRGKMPPPS